jgi:alpha-L-rhamnosidase
VHIFNLGQNFAGIVRLKVKGPAGQRVQLRFGEMLHPDGRLMTENLRKARVQDFYVLKGDPEGEIYTPRFTFHGFQYVEITGYPGTPSLDAITGIVLHSDTPFASTFECSDPMVNQLFQNVVWTQRANFIDLPTDCPQRDERMGWTGDAQAFVRTATYNADVAAFYTKWLRELMEAQHPYGAFPDYAPYPFQHGQGFGSAWGDAGVICPWTIYHVYGDTRVIRRCWEPMTRFMEWRKQSSKGDLGVVHGNEWGDWLAVNESTPLDYIDTIYFAYTAKLMAEMATAIGKSGEAADYDSLFSRIEAAFRKKYLRPGGELTVDTQTAYALALMVGLVPDASREAAGAKLAAKIRKNGDRMATGFLGTRPLLPVLSSVGQHDLATVLLQSREFPSWGYEIEQGATTIWERWDSYTKEDGFGKHNAAMNSFSHYSFGAVFEWVFSELAGIDTDGPGFKKLRLRPSPPSPGSNPRNEPIHWVKASYDSIRGPIQVAWKRQDERFTLDATIPANTTATVVLPTDSPAKVTETGQPLDKATGVRLLEVKAGRTHVAVDSGSYRFVVGP